MSHSIERPYCVGLHEISLPEDARPRLSAVYAGLRDRQEDTAEWEDVLASLREQADGARAEKSPRSDRAAELYRAAGADPKAAFSDSRLVGFDVLEGAAVLALHSGPSAAFTVQAHRVLDGRHHVFEGESSQASRYPAVRDGVVDAVSRYQPRARGTAPPAAAFCAANWYYLLKSDGDVAGDAQLVVTFARRPGVTFSLNIHGLVEPAKEPPFAQRVARDLAELTRLGGQVKQLHAGERRYGGQSGEVVAIHVSGEGAGAGGDYKYFWHAPGRPMDAYVPEIEAELVAEGGHGIGQEELDTLWAELMEGFKLR